MWLGLFKDFLQVHLSVYMLESSLFTRIGAKNLTAYVVFVCAASVNVSFDQCAYSHIEELLYESLSWLCIKAC